MNGSFSHFAVESRKIFDATEQARMSLSKLKIIRTDWFTRNELQAMQTGQLVCRSPSLQADSRFALCRLETTWTWNRRL